MRTATTEQKMYEVFHSEFGLKPEWLGKTFQDRGQTFKITGLNPRSKKFPVLTNTGVSFSAPFVAAVMTNTVDKYKKKKQADFEKKNAVMLKQARANFASQAQYFGVPKTWLDQTFKHGRKVYTVVGVKDSKYPVVTKASDGTIMFFTVDLLKDLLKTAA